MASHLGFVEQIIQGRVKRERIQAIKQQVMPFIVGEDIRCSLPLYFMSTLLYLLFVYFTTFQNCKYMHGELLQDLFPMNRFYSSKISLWVVYIRTVCQRLQYWSAICLQCTFFQSVLFYALCFLGGGTLLSLDPGPKGMSNL